MPEQKHFQVRGLYFFRFIHIDKLIFSMLFNFAEYITSKKCDSIMSPMISKQNTACSTYGSFKQLINIWIRYETGIWPGFVYLSQY